MEVTSGFLQAGIEFINYDSGKKPLIADNVIINGLIDCCEQVIIEKDVFSGHDIMILTGGHDPNEFGEARRKSSNSLPIHIEEGVWLGTRCIILGGVTIGQHAVIGAGAVVTQDIPSYALAVGVPARVVKYYGTTYQGKVGEEYLSKGYEALYENISRLPYHYAIIW